MANQNTPPEFPSPDFQEDLTCENNSECAHRELRELDDDFIREMIDFYVLGSPSPEECIETEILISESDTAREYYNDLFNEIIPAAERDDAPDNRCGSFFSTLIGAE